MTQKSPEVRETKKPKTPGRSFVEALLNRKPFFVDPSSGQKKKSYGKPRKSKARITHQHISRKKKDRTSEHPDHLKQNNVKHRKTMKSPITSA